MSTDTKDLEKEQLIYRCEILESTIKGLKDSNTSFAETINTIEEKLASIRIDLVTLLRLNSVRVQETPVVKDLANKKAIEILESNVSDQLSLCTESISYLLRDIS